MGNVAIGAAVSLGFILVGGVLRAVGMEGHDAAAPSYWHAPSVGDASSSCQPPLR